MKEFKLDFDKKNTTWTVYRCDTFSVTVVHWTSPNYSYGSEVSEIIGVKNHWNIYANVFDTHPGYDKVGTLKDILPLHGGCSYDQRIIQEPSEFKYDWQKRYESLKLGSDYAHIWNNKEDVGIEEGIPYDIKQDASDLVNALLNWDWMAEAPSDE